MRLWVLAAALALSGCDLGQARVREGTAALADQIATHKCAKIWAGSDWANLVAKGRTGWGSGMNDCIGMLQPPIYNTLVGTPTSQLGEVITDLEFDE